ncbi:MAG: sigma factor, partial [bacterium]
MVSDAELVSLCQQGQQAAFAELVERYEKKVYNLAYRMLGNGEDARDLVQEAFLKVYYALPDFR